MKKNKDMKTQNTNLIDDLLKEISPLEQSKTDAKMIIAAKIDEAMKAKGWKKKDLLEAVGKGNPSIVTKWLSGTHNFTVDTLVEIENALGIQLLNVKEKEEVVVKYHVVVSQRAEPCSVSDNYDDFFGSDLNFKSEIFLSGRNFYYKNGQA